MKLSVGNKGMPNMAPKLCVRNKWDSTVQLHQ